MRALKSHTPLILEAERWLWAHPETGFSEHQTQEYLTQKYESLGYFVVRAENIPGFYVDIDTKREGPTVALFAEMDAVIVPAHPDADKETGAVHACGHHAQCAALLGVAAALKEEGVLDNLCGRIRLINVPAEENVEALKRREMVKKGIISHTCGKREALFRGWLEGVDLCFMVHLMTASPRAEIFCRTSGAGGFFKTALFCGGDVSPLQTCALAIHNINALRETFKNTDTVRISPVVLPSGEMEITIRAASLEAMKDAEKKVNFSLLAAAVATGAGAHISTRLQTLPLKNHRKLMTVAQAAAEKVSGRENCSFIEKGHGAGTDLGDVSCLIPTLQSYIRGAEGPSHSERYFIADTYTACVKNALYQLETLSLLLQNGAQRAREVIDSFTPLFKTSKEYFDFVKSAEKQVFLPACSGGEIEINS